jgi:hypothetical protein
MLTVVHMYVSPILSVPIRSGCPNPTTVQFIDDHILHTPYTTQHVYPCHCPIKTASPIKIWDEKEVKPLLAAADQHIKALLDVLHIKILLKGHSDFLYTLQRHFNVSLKSSR